MATSKAARLAATARYEKKNIIRVTVKLNRKYDGDIIELLDGKDNVSGYIKELLRREAAK